MKHGVGFFFTKGEVILIARALKAAAALKGQPTEKAFDVLLAGAARRYRER